MKLELTNLTKRYGSLVALDGLSIAFEPGIYGILGANGAGKSTMMNLITDNVKRDAGSITFDGREILELGDEFRAILGFMPQQQGIYEHMTAQSFASYMARLKGMKGAELRRQVDEVLELTNLANVRHKKVGGLSGGMKQRVLLAQALLGDPKVLLLDEPTAGLDPKERVRIRSFIKELARDRIVLLATHIVTDIESIADKVLLMKKGRLVNVDTPQALIAAIPSAWEPVAHHLSLEDVYLCFLGE
ncbi:MAG: ABC transporter ATP-binding protein [Oscillospiraceae bacterium]|nr:ABC transporter ATP-binding protein [Oscillospiraceae bacterium]